MALADLSFPSYFGGFHVPKMSDANILNILRHVDRPNPVAPGAALAQATVSETVVHGGDLWAGALTDGSAVEGGPMAGEQACGDNRVAPETDNGKQRNHKHRGGVNITAKTGAMVAIGVAVTVRAWVALDKWWNRKRKFTNKVDTTRVDALRGLLSNALREEDEERRAVEGDAAADDDGTEEMPGPGLPGGRPNKRRVRRGRNAAARFLRRWIDWGKVEFPNAAGSTRLADVEAVKRALCREMRSKDVRDKDIAHYKDVITMAILMPSEEEEAVARMLATSAAGNWQRATQGWEQRRPMLDFWGMDPGAQYRER